MSESVQFQADNTPKKPRPKDRYLEISGTNEYGRPKAHVTFTYAERYSDGTEKVLREMVISLKPIISVFHHAGYINVDMDFRNSSDIDLAMIWDLLEEYKRPINSVDWLPEEIESGVYEDESGNERLVYFPVLEVSLHPAGKETEFAIIGENPLFFTLQPNGPKGEPCVLQFTFLEDWFFVTEGDKINVDLASIRDEVVSELAMEMAEPNHNSNGNNT